MDFKEKIEFICDSMFGKLAKWLRMSGYFTIYLKSIERENFIKNININLLGNKILITKDSKILNLNPQIFFLDKIYVEEQFEIIKEKFKLSFKDAFTICMECNYQLKPANKEENKEKIPEYVYKNFNEFNMCEKCGRIYWQGSHYKEMKKKVEN
ncbi:MAG: Mut7-C RNAse domain-containing protein [Candidatus Goldbacteria bacterium]|nr:Mut7-C RNAse domain-containing protein [Candidatus Goldiibacteriota bacterium]